MKENESALYSQYIIDGIRCDMTPAELLDECMEYPDTDVPLRGSFADIVDEATEPPLSPSVYDMDRLDEYIRTTEAASFQEREFTLLYPEQFTRLQIAKALIARLWSEGHFRLGDLRIWAQWDWNTRPIGSMAALYSSISAGSEYIYGLGVKMADYLFIEGDGSSSAKFYAWLPETEEEEIEASEHSLFKSSPYESHHPWITDRRGCASSAVPSEDSWIIYIPFDTCSYRLGGSLLSQTSGQAGGPGPQIQDPDYFIDCYEVVRELVEDGIVMAGTGVADGGLATAAARMCTGTGMEMDISGIMSSYQENDRMRILFGEIPGVILQISGSDYDYVDSQLTLQDVAYYPLGHPAVGTGGIRISEQGRRGVADILASLLNQASEGED